MSSFTTIRARAEQRKGGVEALNELLPPAPVNGTLNTIGDHRSGRNDQADFLQWVFLESR